MYLIATELHKFYSETTQDVEKEKIVSISLAKLTQRKTTFDENSTTTPSPATTQPNTPQKQDIKK